MILPALGVTARGIMWKNPCIINNNGKYQKTCKINNKEGYCQYIIGKTVGTCKSFINVKKIFPNRINPTPSKPSTTEPTMPCINSKKNNTGYR
mgnify:CR=1 FL=1